MIYNNYIHNRYSTTRSSYMFCSNCGSKINNDAKFCTNCGAMVERNVVEQTCSRIVQPTQVSPVFVPAKCTTCGAALKVNSGQSAAVCPYCNSQFIVAKAIQNYNIQIRGPVNVQSATVNVNNTGYSTKNLLSRARDFERNKDYKNALTYYHRVLDIDNTIIEAKSAVSRIEYYIESIPFFSSWAKYSDMGAFGFWFGQLSLWKGYLEFVSKSGKKKERFSLDGIRALQNSNKGMQFICNEKFLPQVFNPQGVPIDGWIAIINNAKMGVYPPKKY